MAGVGYQIHCAAGPSSLQNAEQEFLFVPLMGRAHPLTLGGCSEAKQVELVNHLGCFPVSGKQGDVAGVSPQKAQHSKNKVAVPLDKGPPYRVRVKRKSIDQTRFGNRNPSFAATLEDLWGVASHLSFNPNSRPRLGAASREPSQTSQSLGWPLPAALSQHGICLRVGPLKVPVSASCSIKTNCHPFSVKNLPATGSVWPSCQGKRWAKSLCSTANCGEGERGSVLAGG